MNNVKREERRAKSEIRSQHHKPTASTAAHANSLFAVRCSLFFAVAVALAAIGSPALAQTAPKLKKGDWPMWGGSADRNMVSDETGIPSSWDVKTGKNIKWSAPLGSQTYGNPVIAGGKVFVGTNNGGGFRPKAKGDKGIVLCFEESSGKLLWQATHDKLSTGQVNDWPEQGICSTVCVDGDRVYYVSNRCELVCADVAGLKPGKNTGPFTDEKYNEEGDADFVWILDMIEELAVFPHNLATSSPVIAGDLVYILTSNGVDEGHLNLPSPDAPAFIAVDKRTGKVVWHRADPGKHTLHGQWSSPAYGTIAGTPTVVFAGGDGWAYGFEPLKGEPLWKYNLNPPDAKYVLGGRGTKSYIIATPVIANDHVFLCVGQDPEHGEGVGHLHRIDASKRGDITQSGKSWSVDGEEFHRSLSTACVRDGFVYDADLSGFLYCFDEKTGKRHWRYDTQAAVWGSPYFVDGKIMLGDEDGEIAILKPGAEMKEIGVVDMRSAVYTTPVAANGVLFISTKNRLYAIQEGAQSPPASGSPAK